MEFKRIFRAVVGSGVVMILLMIMLYDFELNSMNLSNVLFFVGTFLFFPGFAIVTGATQVFESSGYLTRKIFAKNPENDFKTFADYKEYKRQKRMMTNKKGRGLTILVLGGIYITISFVMGFFV